MPIIIFAKDDKSSLIICQNLDEVEMELETYDVQNDLYELFDSEAKPLIARVVKTKSTSKSKWWSFIIGPIELERIEVVEDETALPDKEKVIRRLKRHLSHLPSDPIKDMELKNKSLNELIELNLAVK